MYQYMYIYMYTFISKNRILKKTRYILSTNGTKRTHALTYRIADLVPDHPVFPPLQEGGGRTLVHGNRVPGASRGVPAVVHWQLEVRALVQPESGCKQCLINI